MDSCSDGCAGVGRSSAQLPRWQGPHCKRNYKDKILCRPLLGGVFGGLFWFFFCSCGFARLTQAALCWQKGPALGGLHSAGAWLSPYCYGISASRAEKMQLGQFVSTKKNTNEPAACWVRYLMTSHTQNCLAKSPGSSSNETQMDSGSKKFTQRPHFFPHFCLVKYQMRSCSLALMPRPHQH